MVLFESQNNYETLSKLKTAAGVHELLNTWSQWILEPVQLFPFFFLWFPALFCRICPHVLLGLSTSCLPFFSVYTLSVSQSKCVCLLVFVSLSVLCLSRFVSGVVMCTSFGLYSSLGSFWMSPWWFCQCCFLCFGPWTFWTVNVSSKLTLCLLTFLPWCFVFGSSSLFKV